MKRKNDKKAENIHRNHRSRMHKRFLNTGFDHFEPHQVLEYFLFFPIARKDTNPTAHRILNAFKGDLERVFNAKPAEMMKVEGVGEKTAQFFSLLRLIERKYLNDTEDGGERIRCRREIMERMVTFLQGEQEGTVCVMFFNNSVEPLDTVRYVRNNPGFPCPDFRLIVKDAMNRNAGSLAVARKAEGKIVFSSREREVFRDLDYALRRLDMCLVDFFAVNETGGEACFGQNELDLEFFTEA